MWATQWLTFLVGAAVIFIPGLAIGFALRLRGFHAVAAAPPLSFAVIGVTTLAAVVVPFRWSLLPVVVATAALTVVALGVSTWVLPSRAEQWAPETGWSNAVAPWLAIALGAGLLIPRLLVVLGEPESISQTFDNIYHLNAVRHILDTGAAAPTDQLIPGFYPSLWHAFVSIVSQVSGASVPAATNVSAVLIAGIVWPLACVLLVRQVAGRALGPQIAAGVLAAGLAGYPLLMLDFGVLYPNVLSISLFPSVLAALIITARVGLEPPEDRGTWWLLLFAWVPALALAHPSTLMAFFAVGIWPAAAGGWRYFRSARRWRVREWLSAAAWIGGLAIAAALLIEARPTHAQAFWRAYTSWSEAILQVVTNSFRELPIEWVPTILVLIGIVWIVVRERARWWLVAGWLTLGVIYVVGAAAPDGYLRYGLTGTWYSDMFRVMALFPVIVIPLAAVGFGALVTSSVRLAAARHRPLVEGVAVAVLGGAVLAGTQFGAPLIRATDAARGMYAMTDSSPLLTLDERALLLRLPDHVSTDEAIVGSPWTGTSLAYALADREVLVPHIYQEIDDDAAVILNSLDRAGSRPEVCAALAETRVRWLLDFGPREIHGGDHRYPGLDAAVGSGAVELVDSEGDAARLYRITACSPD